MMKQKQLHILAVLVALLVQPCGAWADNLKNGDIFVVDGISYQVDGTTLAGLSDWRIPKVSVSSGESRKPAIDPSTTGSISIQEEVTGPDGVSYKVVLLSYSFYGCSGLTSVSLPSTIVQITNEAFYGCTGLTSIDLPSSLIAIGQGVFWDCSNLESFTIPESVETVYNNPFKGTAWYNNQPDGLIYKDNILLAVKGTPHLGDVVIKNGTRMITDEVFFDNDITSLKIPSSVSKIGRDALTWCKKLESIVVESGNETYDSRNNCNAIIDTKNNTLMIGCKNTVIPDDITSIGAKAFAGSGLTSIVIPHSVTSIGSRAFDDCNSLTTITIGKGVNKLDYFQCDNLREIYSYIKDPTNVNSPNYDLFSYFTRTNGTLYVPTGTKEKYQAVDGWKNFANIVESDDLMLPLEVGETFVAGGLSYMVTNTNPLEVQVGGIRSGNYYYAVDNTTAQTLTSVEIPESVVGSDNKTYTVTGFGNYAFFNCRALTEVHSKAKTPKCFSLGTVFYSVYETATLYVPVGSLLFYTNQNSYPWNRFKNIVLEGADIDNSLATGESFTVDGISYVVTNPFEVMVGARRPNHIKAIDEKTEGALAIPATVKGPDGYQYTVTAIGDDAFAGCSGLTSVTLPNSIASIGLYAFQGCSGLTSIIIPASVINIGSGILAYCSGLTSIIVESGNSIYDSRNNCNAIIRKAGNLLVSGCKSTIIPGDVKQFDQWSMAGITGLTSFTFPEGTEKVGFNMFTDCTDLATVKLPNTIKQINTQAFSGCSSLASIFIPKSVTSIGSNAFEKCGALTSIVVEEGNTVFDSRDICNAIIKTETNELLHGSNKTVIPNTVTAIGSNAFNWRTSLTAITIPNSVTSIGNYAFNGCSSLAEVTSEIKEPFDIASNVFNSNIYKDATLYVPAGTQDAYMSKTGWKEFKNIKKIMPEGVFTALTKEGVEMTFRIISKEEATCHVGDGEEASVDVSTSGQVTIPQTANGYKVVAIGSKGFYNCAKLTHIWLHEGIESIGDLAFYGCTSLRVLDLPKSIKHIASNAFNGCSSNLTVNVPYGSAGVLPPSVPVKVNVTKPAAEEIYVLERIFIPKPVNSLGERLFSFCKEAKAMVVDAENKVFDSREACNAIIRTEDNTLLFGCQNTVIPETVEAIESYAFEGHSKLKAIAIPAKVKAIGEQAFTGCTALEKVTTEILVPFAINDNTFDAETYQTATLYVPAGTKAKYEATDGWKNFKSIVQMDLKEVGDGAEIAFGGEEGLVDESTDLGGSVVGNILYNITPGNGQYNPAEGCIEVTKPTSDEDIAAIEGKDIFGEDVHNHFTGIIFKVPAGKGSVTVEAETTGSMVLKLRFGEQEPIELVLAGKMKMKVPYDVKQPTHVYIYGAQAAAARGRQNGPAAGSLKLYGIEVEVENKPGDLNIDGEVDVTDVVELIDMVLAGEYKPAGDINGDGEVDVTDVVELIDMVLAGE